MLSQGVHDCAAACFRCRTLTVVVLHACIDVSANRYVKDGMCGSACKHAGVETEWATMLILSGFNVFADADACCTVGTMANSALWAHHPLPDVLHQKFTPLTLPELQARGYVQSDGKTVVPKAYAVC